MSKKSDTKAAGVVEVKAVEAAPVVKAAPVVEAAPMVKVDNRGARPGVPHITARILAMSEDQREAWLKEKCGTPEIMQEVRARLDDAIKNGREHSGSGKVRDYAALFAGRPYSELVNALPLLTAAIEAAKSDEVARLETIIAKNEAEKARLRGEVIPTKV